MAQTSSQGADRVSLVDHRPDEHLRQPQEKEKPVVLGRLGKEILDQLQIDHPVAEATNHLGVVGPVFQKEQAQSPHRQDVGHVTRQTPSPALIDREERKDPRGRHSHRQVRVQPGVGGLAAKNRRGHGQHEVEAGSIDQDAVHDWTFPSPDRRSQGAAAWPSADCTPRRRSSGLENRSCPAVENRCSSRIREVDPASWINSDSSPWPC